MTDLEKETNMISLAELAEHKMNLIIANIKDIYNIEKETKSFCNSNFENRNLCIEFVQAKEKLRHQSFKTETVRQSMEKMLEDYLGY